MAVARWARWASLEEREVAVAGKEKATLVRTFAVSGREVPKKQVRTSRVEEGIVMVLGSTWSYLFSDRDCPFTLRHESDRSHPSVALAIGSNVIRGIGTLCVLGFDCG